MRSMKVLRSACMLAVAFAMMATVDAVAQARDKPAAPQVRKPAAKAGAQQRKPLAQHGKKKRKPVAATASAAKSKGHARRAPTAKKAPATAPTPVARRASARALPPPVAWVPPPLGPERFYPNGIPELRPEFLHPEGPAVPVQQAAGQRGGAQGGEPEWLP